MASLYGIYKLCRLGPAFETAMKVGQQSIWVQGIATQARWKGH